MNQSQTSLVNPSNTQKVKVGNVCWKDSIMMSDFGSYYLNLVSVTFCTISIHLIFSEIFYVLVW